MNETYRKRVAVSAICSLTLKTRWRDAPSYRRYLDALIARDYQELDIPIILDELRQQQIEEQSQSINVIDDKEVGREELAARIKAREALISELEGQIDMKKAA